MDAIVDPLWLDFVERVSGLIDGRWFFRGEPEIFPALVPKIARPDALGSAGYRRADEIALFDDFKREAQRFEPGIGFTKLDWLAVAQHHGLPTRLLDWTTNPFVAAWFAVRSDNEKSSSRIHMLRIARTRIKEHIDPFGLASDRPVFVRVPPRAARITAQHGVFTLHPDPEQPWTPGGRETTYYPFDIPAESRAFFRLALHVGGFDAGRLMSDLDGICTTLAWEYGNRA